MTPVIGFMDEQLPADYAAEESPLQKLKDVKNRIGKKSSLPRTFGALPVSKPARRRERL